MKFRVLLVDGRKLFREGICALLEKRSDIKVVGETDDAAAAPKLVEALSPDAVILNVAPPTGDAVAAVKRIAAAGGPNRPRVILLTVHTDPPLFREILQAGATGCLTKESASDDLVTAIHTVMAGRIYLSPAIAEAVVAGYVVPPAKNTAKQTLSSRDREILRRAADG